MLENKTGAVIAGDTKKLHMLDLVVFSLAVG